MYKLEYDYRTFLQKVNKQVQLTKSIVLAMDPDFFNKVNTELIDTQKGVPTAYWVSCTTSDVVQDFSNISTYLSGTTISPEVYVIAVNKLLTTLRDTAESCFGKDWSRVVYKMTCSSHYNSFKRSLAKGPWSLIKHHKENKWSLFYEDELLHSGSLLDIAKMNYMFNPFQESLVCVLQGIQTWHVMQSIKYIKRALIELDIYPLLCRGDLFTGANSIKFNDRLYRKRFI